LTTLDSSKRSAAPDVCSNNEIIIGIGIPIIGNHHVTSYMLDIKSFASDREIRIVLIC
jgi:hypothetical protein